MADQTRSPQATQANAPVPANAKPVVAALGVLFVPSKPGDPGYAELEPHGISDEVLKNFPLDGVDLFNTTAAQRFNGRTFLELAEPQRIEYLKVVAGGSAVADASDGRNYGPQPWMSESAIADAALRMKLHAFYRRARQRILAVYYGNFPENRVRRDANDVPILRPGDTHQEVNPNTKTIVTGWDVTGETGPMSWEEEEKARADAKKVLPFWMEGDLIRLDPKRPAPAAAIKTGEGHEYYDVIVLGGGTAGCIIAGRLAERGINPKTGDRLRVAMIEGGFDWSVKDPGIRPGYGYPIRRQMITYVRDGRGPEGGPAYRWPNGDGENFKIVGGCSVHYGNTTWVPGDEDFGFYRKATGVNWDLARFGAAIQEVRDLYGIAQPPASWWSKGDHMVADAARSLGMEVRVPEVGWRNLLERSAPGGLNRYDAKGTSLPWAYVGLNHGLKIIPNAEVDRVLIEKRPGARPVAIGAVYKDQAGQMHEVRAARVVVAMGTTQTPLIMYKSGYGPRDILGDKLIVENPNVGNHLTADVNLVASAYLQDECFPDGTDVGADPWVSMQPRPWPELNVQIRFSAFGAAGVTGIFAPDFGWDHKEYMRNNMGAKHIMNWRCHVGAVPATWRVFPGGKTELVQMDAARCNATKRETLDFMKTWWAKLDNKPVKTAHANNFIVDATKWLPLHKASTCRAGADPKTSVCNEDFDCHDIDNLMFTSGAALPKTFVWSCGPIAIQAAYAWRRMVANHFSRGASTKGFA